MPTTDFTQLRYGISRGVYVTPQSKGDSVVVGGEGRHYGRWSRALTRRAAHLLWFNLTRMLFPEKAPQVTGIAVTAPLRGFDEPLLTTHVEVTRTADGFIEIIGWMGRDTWWARLPEAEGRNLWAKLDLLLYPVGWEGRDRKPRTG